MKKRLIALLVILALSMTFTVVAMAQPGRGDIEFTDNRGGSGGPGDPGPLPPGWELIHGRGNGFDFWSHNLRDIDDHAPATFSFHTNRALNSDPGNIGAAPWDPDSVTSPGNAQRSFEAIRMQTAGDTDAVLSVAVGGFFRGPVRVLQGTQINLNRFEGDGISYGYADNQNGAVAALFHQTITGLAPGNDGIIGTPQAVNTALGSGADIVLLYEAELAQAEKAVVLSAGIGDAHAIIQWTYASTPPPPTP